MKWSMALCASVVLAACAVPDRSSTVADDVRYRADLHAALALAYLEQGLGEVAQREADAALRLDAANAHALHARALLAAMRGDAAQTQRYFEAAMRTRGDAEDPVLAANFAAWLEGDGRGLRTRGRAADNAGRPGLSPLPTRGLTDD